jgi:hypothetical protein
LCDTVESIPRVGEGVPSLAEFSTKNKTIGKVLMKNVPVGSHAKSVQLLPKSLAILALLFVTGSLSTALRAAVATDTNEVWISARTNALGTGAIFGNGAITNPFYGDFDAIIKSLATNTTIHLLPGIHYTIGTNWSGLQLKAYQRVIGAGIDTTTVRRDTNFSYNAGTVVFNSSADGVEVRDLTLDANANGTESYVQSALFLTGNYSKIHRVRAIHSSGNTSTGQECFVIFVSGTNSIVSEAEVSSVRGNYCSAISLTASDNNLCVGSIVEHCKVIFPVLTNGSSSYFQAYLASGTRNALFDGNISEGGGSGFYTDTGSETNLTIVNCTFKNVWYGIGITKSPGYTVDGAFLRNNTIELHTNLSSYGTGYGIVVGNADQTGTVFFRNIVIAGNTIRAYNGVPYPGTRAIETYSAVITNYIGVRILDNTIDKSLSFRFSAQNIWLADNMDLTGTPLHVRQIGAGSPSTVTLDPIDGSVFVSASTTTALTLPTAYCFSGKEVTIANKKTSGSLTVNPPTGQTIVPTGPFVLTPGESARLLSDGVSIWSRLFTTNMFVAVAATNSSGIYTFTHGLGLAPCWIRVVFQCVTADVNTDFAAGDEVDSATVLDQVTILPSAGPSVQVSSDANSITISTLFKYGHDADYAFPQKGVSINYVTCDNYSKWRLKVYAKSNLQ